MTSTQQDVEGAPYLQTDTNGSGTFEDAGSTTFLCFGICDMRIATMFFNGFNVAMILFGVLATGIFGNLFWKGMGAALAAGFPGLILSGIGIYGAKNFELWAMYLATGGFAVLLLMDLIFMQWVGAFFNAIVLFPHAVLTFEMRNEFITKDNYSQQEYL